MVMGIFKQPIDVCAIRLDSVLVPEFNQNIIELGFLKNIKADGKKVNIDLVLPTFALKSEALIAGLTKRTALEQLPSGTDVNINVYADVRPVTTQTVLTPGIADVRNIILVASGKGGVGKSTVASNLAAALQKLGCRTGLLDADVYGPSIPTMFGVKTEEEVKGFKDETSGQTYMLPLERHGVKLMSLGFLVDTSSAMIWRGPMIASACMQMFQNVAWGELDYLVVDLPPGTGDIQLTISQKVAVAGAVVVSTPQDVALADVIRAKAMFDKVNIPILGVVENMSYFVCDGCEKRHEIFTHGGAKAAAERLELGFLGELPLEPKVRAGGDEGAPAVLTHPESQTSQSFIELAHTVATLLAKEVLEKGEAIERTRPQPQSPVTPPSSTKKKGLPVVQ